MPGEKKAEQQPGPLVNHSLVKHAIKVLNATVAETETDEVVESLFAQPEFEAVQSPQE